MLSCVPVPSDAVWKHPRAIAQGTAQVLERGEIRIGFTSPVSYGILDSLTIETHPIFDLLLMPNVNARLRVVDESWWVVSLYTGYKQGFFSDAQPHIAGLQVGEFHLGAMASMFLANRFVLTAGGGIASHIVHGTNPGDEDVAGGVAVLAGAHMLVGERDLVAVNAYLRWGTGGPGMDTPVATVAWDTDLESWEAWHFRFGLSVGEFGFRSMTGASDASPFSTPVMPTFDLWRRI